jgi:3-dehydroquinate synthase
MADSREFEPLTVASHKGPYTLRFIADAGPELAAAASSTHFLIDRRVAELHQGKLASVLAAPSVLLIDASEGEKSLERMPAFVGHLLSKGVRRGQTLTAVGGGIIQDITCFLAATLLRGLDWNFAPTTLLAMADSAIGSKSSINCAGAKNILGTFTPPKAIWTDLSFLDTLDEKDLRSGIGEMLKVHAIEGPAAFDRIAADYPALARDRAVLGRYLRDSLEIKRRIIEADEFDRGPRLVMNYGHSFGHAIEAATAFAIPHGIAVTIGMDLANFAAARLGLGEAEHYRRMRPALSANWRGFESEPIPADRFLAALAKDKKNTATKLGLILPDKSGRIGRREVAADDAFRRACAEYLEKGRREVLP